jgi:DNA-binding transcriptional LysR family regulator
MNIHHLKYFKKLMESEKLTDAAKELYITQPALTNAIKTLEKEIGFVLFVREGQLLVSTENGKMFYRYISRALDNIEEGINMAKLPSRNAEPILRVGREHGVRSEYMRTLIDATLQKLNRTIKDEITIDSKERLLSMLEKGELDIVATLSKTTNESIICASMIRYDLVAVVNIEHPLASQDSVTPKQLSQYKLVTYHPSVPLAERVPATLKKHNIVAEQEYDDDNMLYLVASTDSSTASLVRFTSDLALYPYIKAIEISGLENPLFETCINAKRGPYRIEILEEFIQAAIKWPMPEIEMF